MKIKIFETYKNSWLYDAEIEKCLLPKGRELEVNKLCCFFEVTFVFLQKVTFINHGSTSNMSIQAV